MVYDKKNYMTKTKKEKMAEKAYEEALTDIESYTGDLLLPYMTP